MVIRCDVERLGTVWRARLAQLLHVDREASRVSVGQLILRPSLTGWPPTREDDRFVVAVSFQNCRKVGERENEAAVEHLPGAGGAFGGGQLRMVTNAAHPVWDPDGCEHARRIGYREILDLALCQLAQARFSGEICVTVGWRARRFWIERRERGLGVRDSAVRCGRCRCRCGDRDPRDCQKLPRPHAPEVGKKSVSGPSQGCAAHASNGVE